MAKTVEEIKKEILDELNIGIDANDGSFIASLVGAIATQMAMIDQTVEDVKIQQHPEFADSETLVLLGRKCGLFPKKGVPVLLGVSTIGVVNPFIIGDTVVFAGTDATYTVLRYDDPTQTWVLECDTIGSGQNQIPVSWWKQVSVHTKRRESVDFPVRVISIMRHGRDDEDINSFRLRVIAAHNVTPVAANDQWLTSVLMDGGLSISCVRIEPRKMLQDGVTALAKIYIGGTDYTPASKQLRDECDGVLNPAKPIGMAFEIDSIQRLDSATVEPVLKYTFTHATRENPGADADLRKRIAATIRKSIREAVASTPPREKISIVPSDLVQALNAEMTTSALAITAATITYQTTEYTDAPCVFSMNHIPWATPDQIELKGRKAKKVDQLDAVYPEW